MTHEREAALAGAGLLVVAVPSSTLRDNLRTLRPHLDPDTLVLSAVKGLERDTGKRMSEVSARSCRSCDGRCASFPAPTCRGR